MNCHICLHIVWFHLVVLSCFDCVGNLFMHVVHIDGRSERMICEHCNFVVIIIIIICSPFQLLCLLAILDISLLFNNFGLLLVIFPFFARDLFFRTCLFIHLLYPCFLCCGQNGIWFSKYCLSHLHFYMYVNLWTWISATKSVEQL